MMEIYIICPGCYVIKSGNEVFVYDLSYPFYGTALKGLLSGHLSMGKIDGIIISHYHYDHVGASSIIKKMRGNVGAVYSSGIYVGTGEPHYDLHDLWQTTFDAEVAKYNIPHVYVKQGDVIPSATMEINVLNPFAVDVNPPGTTDTPNDETEVLVQFKQGDFSIVLAGDCPSEHIINNVYPAMVSPGCTVLALPHHGDNTWLVDGILNSTPAIGIIEGTSFVDSDVTADYLTSRGVIPIRLDYALSGINPPYTKANVYKRCKITGYADGTYEIDETLPYVMPCSRAGMVGGY